MLAIKRCAAVLAVAAVVCPPASAGAIQPPVVAPGPPPADGAPGPDQPMHQVEDCTQTTVIPGTDLREPMPGWQLLDMASAWRVSTGVGVVVGVLDTGVTGSPRLPHLVAGGDYVMGRYGDGINDCDGHGTAVASLIAGAPAGPPLPARPEGAAPVAPPPGAPAPEPVPPPPPPPTVTVTATAPPPPPPPPPPEGDAPAWSQAGGTAPLAGPWRQEPAPPDSPDGFVGGAPDAVVVSVRQSSQKFSPVQPKADQDPERSRRAGNVHTLAAAIVHLANMGVKVMNISVVACQSVANLLSDAEIGSAVRYAADERDVLIVSAAGNQGQDGCAQNPDPIPADTSDPLGWNTVRTIVTPGWYSDYVLTVSATDSQGVPLTGEAASMHGPWIGLGAPGADIEALGTDGRVINASVDTRNNTLKPLAGSSFSAAIVSSVAALVRAKFPQLTAFQVRHRLQASAHPPAAGHDNVVGYGVINPVGALTWDIPAGEPFPAPLVTTGRLHPPPPAPRADPRPGHAFAVGALAALAAAAGLALSIVVTRRRRESR
ncbi:serine protease [Mycobacterium nebraskense]|uniref:Serine protease n=1 Tax=Mycobacterium nebraskense TaxID=244292 RepID=A0A1X1Z1B1_9MYCO|nr:S8 family serine peptidase [Mycobacterium nebraskense]ORW17168.1 serine protease [Mycobacterium nebraskense]